MREGGGGGGIVVQGWRITQEPMYNVVKSKLWSKYTYVVSMREELTNRKKGLSVRGAGLGIRGVGLSVGKNGLSVWGKG